MRAPFLLVLLAVSATLTACGGSATVDNESGPSSIAPLERPTSSAASESAASASSGSAVSAALGDASSAGFGANAPAAPRVKDQGAKEIASIPATATAAPTDADYLDQVKAAGINVSGVEDQVVAAGSAACNPSDTVTVGAVAGQLVAQGRTTLSREQIISTLSDNGKAFYCAGEVTAAQPAGATSPAGSAQPASGTQPAVAVPAQH